MEKGGLDSLLFFCCRAHTYTETLAFVFDVFMPTSVKKKPGENFNSALQNLS